LWGQQQANKQTLDTSKYIILLLYLVQPPLLWDTSDMASCPRFTVDRKRKRQKPVYDCDFWDTTPGARLSLARLHGNRCELPPGCGVATMVNGYLMALQGMFLMMRERSVAWGDGFQERSIFCESKPDHCYNCTDFCRVT
jgi:hypothetical protein